MAKGDKIFIREDRPGVGCFKTTVFDLVPGKFFLNHEDITDLHSEVLEDRDIEFLRVFKMLKSI